MTIRRLNVSCLGTDDMAAISEGVWEKTRLKALRYASKARGVK